MDFFTLDISDNFSLDNDISSSYEFDSVSTLFNEKAARFILEDDNEKANEYIKQIFHIKKKKKIKKHMKFFICEECGKIYKSKENTLLHYKNVHLNQKPYICNYCDCEFSHRNGKIYHERKFHTKIFPYQCPHCEKCRFPTKSSLKYHLKAKHNGI